MARRADIDLDPRRFDAYVLAAVLAAVVITSGFSFAQAARAERASGTSLAPALTFPVSLDARGAAASGRLRTTARAVSAGGVQVVRVDVSGQTFDPQRILVDAGSPVVLLFTTERGSRSVVRFAGIGRSVELRGGVTRVELGALRAGVVPVVTEPNEVRAVIIAE